LELYWLSAQTMDVSTALQIFCSKNAIGSKPNDLLVSILENILKNPEEGKYRRLNIEKVVKRLGEVDGVKLLLAAGFVRISDTHYEISSPNVTVLNTVLSGLKERAVGVESSERSGDRTSVTEIKRSGLVEDVPMVDVSTDSKDEPENRQTETADIEEPAPIAQEQNPITQEQNLNELTVKEEKTVKKPVKKAPRSFAERGGVSGSGIDLEAELDKRFNDGSSKYSKSKKKPVSGLDLNAAVDKLGGDDKYTRAMKSGKKIPKSNIVNLAESIDGVQHKKIVTARKKGPNISNLDAAIDGDTSKTVQKRKSIKSKVNPTMLDAAVEEM